MGEIELFRRCLQQKKLGLYVNMLAFYQNPQMRYTNYAIFRDQDVVPNRNFHK